ncbi:MAG TPA: sialidase family protein [Thermoanaerobaculia bacterium]|nr:sialidase family protein [Thermoanaerobaculia bacterium]
MSSCMRRLTFLCAVSALLAATVSFPAEPSFSRSRWIAERKGKFLFTRGVAPTTRPAAPSVVQEPVVIPGAAAKKPQWVRVSRDLLQPDAGAGQPETQTEPFLAVDPAKDTRLLAGYQENRFEDGGARALAYAFSKNSGKTWTEGLLPGLTLDTGGPFQRASDPWVAFGPNGRAYYVSLLFNETNPDNGLFVSASPDSGKTWGPPVPVHLGDRDNFDDKQAMVVDTRADSPFRGRVYVGWDTVVDNRAQLLRMSHSADAGASFSPPVTLESAGANIGAIPVVGPGGLVHTIWLHGTNGFGPFSIHASRSEDGGATWSPPVEVAPVGGAGVRDLRVGALPAVAIDSRNGRLYVVWQDDVLTRGVDQVLLSRSEDGGQTWSEPLRVSDGPDDAPSFTPAVAVAGDGRVAVAYYSLRNDPARRFGVDHYVALSKDGLNFGASRRTTNSSWDVRFAAFSRGFFLGDYQGLAAGKKVFYALWIATQEPSRIDPPARQPDAFVRTIRP